MQYQKDQYMNNKEMYQPSSMNIGSGLYNQNQFNNVAPKSRAQRQQELIQRSVEMENNAPNNARFRYTPQKFDMKNVLHEPGVNTTLFQPEHLRFQKDYSVEDKMNREYQQRQKDLKYEARRLQALEREGYQWKKNEDLMQREQKKREMQQELYKQGKFNANGLAFNPITLEYAQTEQGQNLKKRDEESLVRGYVRAQNLDGRQNSNFNILTGERRQNVDNIVPDPLKDLYSHKIREKDDYYNIKHYALQQQLMGAGPKLVYH